MSFIVTTCISEQKASSVSYNVSQSSVSLIIRNSDSSNNLKQQINDSTSHYWNKYRKVQVKKDIEIYKYMLDKPMYSSMKVQVDNLYKGYIYISNQMLRMANLSLPWIFSDNDHQNSDGYVWSVEQSDTNWFELK